MAVFRAGATALCLSLGMSQAVPAEWLGPARSVMAVSRFVKWPEAADSGLTFRLCLRDDDPALGAFLGLRGETISGRPVSIHPLSPGAFAVRPCHVAYFSDGLASPAILRTLADKPVLTMSPEGGFAERGGDVEIVAGTGGFAINDERLREQGLRVSAQLLKLSGRS